MKEIRLHRTDRASQDSRDLLVRQIVDEVLFSETGNEVLLIKHLE